MVYKTSLGREYEILFERTRDNMTFFFCFLSSVAIRRVIAVPGDIHRNPNQASDINIISIMCKNVTLAMHTHC